MLVTHWWEFFRDGEADKRLIKVLHETAHYLANSSEIKVVAFEDVAEGRVEID